MLFAVGPAARFHAGDRDRQRRLGRHQYGQVKNSVLLGADQLFPIEKQDRLVGTVLEQDLGHAAGLRDLADGGRSLGQGLGEGQVVGWPVYRPGQRKQGQAAIGERFVDFDIAQGFGDDAHNWLSFLRCVTSQNMSSFWWCLECR